MRTALIAILIVVLTAGAASASRIWLFGPNGHVPPWGAGGHGGGGTGCNGTINFGSGCTMGMIP